MIFDDAREKTVPAPLMTEANENPFANGEAFFGKRGMQDMVSTWVASYKRDAAVQDFQSGSISAIFRRDSGDDQERCYANI